MRRSQWVRMGIIGGVGAVLLALGAGCADRTHMTRSYGRAYGEAFAQQQANPQAGRQQPPQGLDSQEASIVARGYRTSLAPKGTTVQEQPMLWVAPSGPGGAPGPYVPPPSVPGAR